MCIISGVLPADLDEFLVVFPSLLLVVDEVISLTWREGGWSFSRTGRLWKNNTRDKNIHDATLEH